MDKITVKGDSLVQQPNQCLETTLSAKNVNLKEEVHLSKIEGLDNMNDEFGTPDMISKFEWPWKIAIALCTILIGILMIVLPISITNLNNWETPFSQLGLSLITTGIVFILIDQFLQKGDRIFSHVIVGEATKRMAKAEKNLASSLEMVCDSLDTLTKQNNVLNGAILTGIQQIYSKRQVGLRDIMDDIRSSTSVKMIGISLREYFLSAGHYYTEMESILNDLCTNPNKKFQILIINPNCEQATIRAERESDSTFNETNTYEKSGLYSDVWHVMRYLNDKQKKIKCDKDNVSRLEAKVYNSAPSCFMVITDKHIYIEQYHYGLPKAGLAGGYYPLLKFSSYPSDEKENRNTPIKIAEHLDGHFKYIWEQLGSINVTKFIDEHCQGVSKSAWECKMINLFTNRNFAEDRIKYLLRESQYIKLIGISLRDFLHTGKDYYEILKSKGQSKNINCLILDPFSEQGKLRSEREEPSVLEGNLHYEVLTSIRSIQRLQTKDSVKIDAKLFSASPSCFLIITDIGIIVEQYHYGSSGATILGGKVPVIEFAKESQMYNELTGHFDYIWNHASSTTINDWQSKHAIVGKNGNG